MRSDYVKLGGKHLEYILAGPITSAPTLVFMHEGLGCAALWKNFPQRLAEQTGYAFLMYSRPGYGRSDPADLPLKPTYLHEQAKVLQNIIEHFEIWHPVLVGHSDGASISLIYAGSEMKPAPSAVIVEAPHVFVEPIAHDGIADVIRRYEETPFRARMQHLHGEKADDTFYGWSSAWQQPAFQDWNIEDLLPGIVIPTLVMQGTNDQYGTLAQVDAVIDGVTGPVETMVLENCGHVPHLEQPEETLAAMVAFLRQWLKTNP